MPRGAQTIPDPEAIRYSTERAGYAAQNWAIYQLRESPEKDKYQRREPWFFWAKMLWTRFTEIGIARKPWYEHKEVGPWDTLWSEKYQMSYQQEDWDEKKLQHYIENYNSWSRRVAFRSLIKELTTGAYRRNFDIDFSVKYAGSTSDNAEITIHNVIPEKHNIIEDTPIVIKSGYLGCYDTIFMGKIQSVEPEISGSDVLAKLKVVSDFKAFLGNLPFGRSYPVGTKYMTIVNDLLKLSPVPIGYIHPTSKQVKDAPFTIVTGETIKEQFDKIAEAIYYVYSFQGGRFFFVSRGLESWHGVPIPTFRLNAITGLVEVARTSDEEGIKYQVTSLLMPYFVPNAILYVETNLFDELQLKVNEIEFRSDESSHYVIMKCTPAELSQVDPAQLRYEEYFS